MCEPTTEAGRRLAARYGKGNVANAVLAIEAEARADCETRLDVERLADLVLAALTEWTGEPSDGVSAAIRRAIASKAAAEYLAADPDEETT